MSTTERHQHIVTLRGAEEDLELAGFPEQAQLAREIRGKLERGTVLDRYDRTVLIQLENTLQRTGSDYDLDVYKIWRDLR